MENVGVALIITLIGMGVIFVVLLLLLASILILNRLFPYIPPPPVQPAITAPSGDDEVVAVIQAAITAYLGREPGKIAVKKSS